MSGGGGHGAHGGDHGKVQPIHYHGRNYKLVSDISDSLGRDPNKVYAELEKLHDKDAYRRHVHRKSLSRSSLLHVVDNVMKDHAKELGVDYDDHKAATLHHLDEDKRMKIGLKLAEEIGYGLAEIVGGTELKEFYKSKSNPALLNRFIEGEFRGMIQGGMDLNRLAKMLSEEPHALRAVIEGTPEALQSSDLAKVINAYLENTTPESHNKKAYEVALEQYVNKSADNYKDLIKRLNTRFKDLKLDVEASEILDKETAIAHYIASLSDSYAIPEKHILGLTRKGKPLNIPKAANDNEAEHGDAHAAAGGHGH